MLFNPFAGQEPELVYAPEFDQWVEPVHIMIPRSQDDPRDPSPLPAWIVPHYVPELHPDDRVEVDGLPCTSVSRTLIDMAEECDEAQLWQLFWNAREKGMLDRDALMASRSRVEWRPSLGMVDRVIADFFP